MLDLVSLKMKCPVCYESLMDEEKLIDNVPSVKLDINIANKTGSIWLSSIYGSYNYYSEIEIRDNEKGIFSCPHCHSELKSEKSCEICSSPLVDLNLADGGIVRFCSRSNCQNHSVEFQDLKTALGKIYEDFSYHGNSMKNITIVKRPEKIPPTKISETEKEIISSGTYLQSFCPHCKKSLIENNLLKLKVEKNNDETGYLFLSPYLNLFTHQSTIKLPEKKAVKSIKCWHCDTKLIVKDKKCPVCNSNIAKISVAAMSKMIDFYICSQKGCTWHGLSDEDLKYIIFEDSEEW